MRTTALQIITRAMRLINALPSGSAPEGEDAADALDTLNTLLDASSNERLLQPSLPQVIHNWPGNVKEQTLGPGLDIDISIIPVKFWSASFRWSENRIIPMQIIDQEQYNYIVYQNWKGPWPRYLCYLRSSDMDNTAKVLIWPLPVNNTDIFIRYQRDLVLFPECDSSLDLLPGYKMWLQYKLAILLAPEFTEGVVPISVIQEEARLKSQIGVINEQKSHVVSGLTAVVPKYRRGLNGGIPQIYAGEFGITTGLN